MYSIVLWNPKKSAFWINGNHLMHLTTSTLLSICTKPCNYTAISNWPCAEKKSFPFRMLHNIWNEWRKNRKTLGRRHIFFQMKNQFWEDIYHRSILSIRKNEAAGSTSVELGSTLSILLWFSRLYWTRHIKIRAESCPIQNHINYTTNPW